MVDMKKNDAWCCGIFCVTTVVLLVNPVVFGMKSGFLDAMGSALDWVMLGIERALGDKYKLGFDGRFPMVLYSRQIAICLVGAVCFNVCSILSVLVTRESIWGGYEKAVARVMTRYGCSRLRAVIHIHFAFIFILVPILMFCVLSVGNSVFGWFQFRINSVFVLAFFPVLFLFLAGCNISNVVMLLAEYVFFNVNRVISWLI